MKTIATLVCFFSLSLSTLAQSSEAVLYNFGQIPVDGNTPTGAVVVDSAGNVYGTTQYGGVNLCGTIFKVDPTGVETTLYSFTCMGDGGHPVAGLLLDAAGNLYGTVPINGSFNAGVLFKFNLALSSYAVLHEFGAAGDGQQPNAVTQKSGVIYGTTLLGGTSGCGTVWKLAAGAYSVLYSFQCAPDGRSPLGSVALDAAGNLYGTTAIGGSHLQGTVFTIAAAGKAK